MYFFGTQLLTLLGGEISSNTATLFNPENPGSGNFGGIWYRWGVIFKYMGEAYEGDIPETKSPIVVKDNTFEGEASNLFVNNTLSIEKKLISGSEIWVHCDTDTVLTNGYSKYNKDEAGNVIDPATYFYADNGDAVWLDGGEAKSVQSYKLVFNANDGSGATYESVMPRDKDKALTANGFTRAGYTFADWNTAVDDSGDALADGEVVNNLAALGATLNLYAQWTLNKPTVTITNGAAGVTYNGTDFTVTANASHGAGEGVAFTYKWYKDGKELADNTGASIPVQNVADSGRYSVKVTASEKVGAQSTESEEVFVTVTINKKKLTATVNNATVAYGDAKPEFSLSYDGFVDGDGEVDLTVSGLDFNCDYSAGSAYGVYTVTASGLASGNYEISYTGGSLNVTKRIITVTVDSGLSSKVGEDIKPLTYKITAGSLANGDSAAAVFELATAATNTSEAGKYDVTLTTLNDNYDITFLGGAGAYEITKSDINPGDNTGDNTRKPGDNPGSGDNPGGNTGGDNPGSGDNTGNNPGGGSGDNAGDNPGGGNSADIGNGGNVGGGENPTGEVNVLVIIFIALAVLFTAGGIVNIIFIRKKKREQREAAEAAAEATEAGLDPTDSDADVD